jgi:dihydrolipoamide dehydrogenase
MAETLERSQVVVIGGGPGGYPAAFKAADLGLQVTLVDIEENPGGVCLYRGCIPSKALLHLAKLLKESREAAAWGLKFAEPEIDLAQVRAWKEGIVRQMTGGTAQLAKQRKITMIQGRATFSDAHTLKIEKADGSEAILPFETAILATGSHPTKIPSLSLDSPRLMDSTAALALADIPERLLVVGGGYIGLELGSVYAALGSQVSVVEMTDGLLPGADRDLVRVVAKELGKAFHEIMLKTTVVSLQEEAAGIRVTFKGDEVKEPEQLFDKVLVSVGRSPNSANLGLENTRVEVTARGFIKVDGQRRTTEPSIFAIGDVAGEPMLAHKATHEGHVAAETIAGRKVAFEPHAIPCVVFTDPELAWCGLTELEAKATGREISVTRFPWGASGRATTLSRTDGTTKLISDPESGRILGVGIAGAGAGELIAEGVLAIEMAALASDLALTIHPHPTLSETVMESAEAFSEQSTHFYRATRKR